MSGYGYQTKDGYWKKVTARTLSEVKGVPDRCALCKATGNLTIDHILPRSTNPEAKGKLANYRLLCQKCNEQKGADMPAPQHAGKPFLSTCASTHADRYNFKTHHKKPL